MSRTRTISALHNVPLTNLATEQTDFLHFIIHLRNSRYSHYPQILLTSHISFIAAKSMNDRVRLFGLTSSLYDQDLGTETG